MMKKQQKVKQTIFCLLIMLIWSQSSGVLASGFNQVQSIELQKGWNAIYLKVTPDRKALDDYFAETPITQVNTFFDDSAAIQFIVDPDEQKWKKERWRKWISPNSEDSALTDLFVLSANRAYLVFATQDYQWRLEGQTQTPANHWFPNTYNLTGFYIDDDARVSFRDYFSGSAAHQSLNIYKLESGNWTKVISPATERIQSNQAYWIYTKGASNYPGPLQIRLNTGQSSLDFNAISRRLNVSVRNLGIKGTRFEFEHVSGNNSDLVPILYQVQRNGQTSINSDLTAIGNRSISQGEYRKLTFVIDRRQMSRDENRESLLFVSGSGMRIPIPVAAQRN